MDMKINAKKVIHNRKVRAWSQQHLADASAVSLRTIQRVENNGSGSLETIKSLASCFELDVNALFEIETDIETQPAKIQPTKVQPVVKSWRLKSKSKVAVACSLGVALLSSVLLLSPLSMASNIGMAAQENGTSSITDSDMANNAEHHIYSHEVEMFLPKDVLVEVLIGAKWETEITPKVSGSVKIYLKNSVLFIDKATLTKTARGTKVTTR
jgi:DNA-binding XRE family transcriptional regulator